MDASQRILSSEMEGAHAIKDKRALDEAIKNKSYQKREERLESVLGEARESAKAYYTANAGSGVQLMGRNEGSDGEDWLEVARTSGKSAPTQESASIYAIRMYDG